MWGFVWLIIRSPFGKCNGIAVEQLIRYGKFNMNVKHFHNQYELFYIIEGERQFFFDNKSYNAHAGDLAIIDTNLVHHMFNHV